MVSAEHSRKVAQCLPTGSASDIGAPIGLRHSETAVRALEPANISSAFGFSSRYVEITLSKPRITSTGCALYVGVIPPTPWLACYP